MPLVAVDGVGDLVLEGSQGFLGALALVELASVIDPALGVVTDLDRSDVECPVELAVASGVALRPPAAQASSTAHIPDTRVGRSSP
jgi:hypothetical protein